MRRRGQPRRAPSPCRRRSRAPAIGRPHRPRPHRAAARTVIDLELPGDVDDAQTCGIVHQPVPKRDDRGVEVPCTAAAAEDQQHRAGRRAARARLAAQRPVGGQHGRAHRVAGDFHPLGVSEQRRRLAVRDADSRRPAREHLVRQPGTEFCSCSTSGTPRSTAARPTGIDTYPPKPMTTSGLVGAEPSPRRHRRRRDPCRRRQQRPRAGAVEPARAQAAERDARLGNETGLKAVRRADEEDVVMLGGEVPCYR